MWLAWSDGIIFHVKRDEGITSERGDTSAFERSD